jgi:hypothetical protein
MNSSTISQSHWSGRVRLTGPSESRGHQERFGDDSNDHTEEVVEKLATVLIRMKPVVDIG